jgi:ketosteroid isomerase-like protein
MRFQLTKIIEDRSPVVVTKALEKCLKQEAWEIKQLDQQMIALGIGASRTKVNMSDRATFAIDYREGATTVQVEVEYQYAWFLSEESQNDAVHSRFESIFANTRVALDLVPEPLVLQSPALEPPAFPSQPTPSQPPVPFLEPVVLPAADESSADGGLPHQPTQTVPPSRVESLSAASSIAPEPSPIAREPSPIAREPKRASRYLLGSSLLTRRHGFRAMSLVASLILALCGVVGISHFKHRPLSSSAPGTVPSVQTATRRSVPSPPNNPTPLVSHPSTQDHPFDSAATRRSQSEDLRRWLEQWAASERTRDAKTQASFYADDVYPYLSINHATRDTVYQNKLDAIQNRKGLWTLKLEDISIQTETPYSASVLLKKLVMAQTDSVRVDEHRTSSFLTLKRSPNGWQITGERNLR